ncbi:gastrula zinc finger protein XlCGF57.1-like [Anopheles cruzii]|uniref:gastrula zinc finger protein XlCGF57.1-like n=1 Tax=Anopheles cruzii TaxID=68878 RepID=UPI0022EC1E26|nr:gastrula zinc finger protein XlCGF57.1-like [Anopheles cruzii]
MSLKICRICLNPTDMDGYSIYELASGESTLYVVLHRLYPFAFSEDDSEQWPKKVCKDCKPKILVAYELYQLCMASGERLQRLLTDNRVDSFDEHGLTGLQKESGVAVEKEFVPCETLDDCVSQFPIKDEEPARVEDKLDPDAVEQYPCLYCEGVWFPLQSRLDDHLKKLHVNRIHYCAPCSRVFSDKDKFECHRKCHALGRTFFCTSCEKGFQTAEGHRLHVLSHDDPYLCSECGKKFETKSNLKQHVKRHSNVKPFVCKLCPSKFHSKGELQTHQYTHSKVKQFSCDVCGGQFTKNSSLVKHKRIHTGLRPFNCDACSRSFYSADLLKRHMLSHTGEKPFKCRYCGRQFSQSNDMVKHTRTHVGANIYQCDRCDDSFRLLSELRNHYMVHYQQDSEKCTGSTAVIDDREIRFTSTDILNLRYLKEASQKKSDE